MFLLNSLLIFCGTEVLNGEMKIKVYVFSVDLPGDLPAGRKAGMVSDAGHKLVREQLGSMTGEDFNCRPFSFGPSGKPFFSGCEIQFSISHKGNTVAAAFSPYEVGVDIEEAGEFSRRVADRVFTACERQYFYAARHADERNIRGYSVWTAKEAYLKLNGTGIAGGLGFDTANEQGLLPVIASEKYPPARLYTRRLKREDACEEGWTWVLSVCSREEAEIEILYIN